MIALRFIALTSRVPGLLLLSTLCLMLPAAPSWSQSEPDSTATPLVLSDLSCSELQSVFYEIIPRYVYDDDPDALYEIVIHAGDRCEMGEPLGRTTILASIWDGSFSEAVYGYEVIGWLVDSHNDAKIQGAGDERAVFDTFTGDFADQMLPHVKSDSLEEFFCLFYSGRQAEAWKLLNSESLNDTWLRYYYDEEIDRLESAGAPYIVTAHWGLWEPGGDQELVGTRQLAGAAVEQRGSAWFARLVIESRLGRSANPYFVSANGISGFSDRWNALLLAVEGGLTVWRSERHLADVFAGLGYDTVAPFKNEQITRSGLNLSLGVGYRLHLDRSGRWFTAVDGRYEWVSERNGGGTPLGGSAYSMRLGLGFRLGTDPQPRLQALGKRP